MSMSMKFLINIVQLPNAGSSWRCPSKLPPSRADKHPDFCGQLHYLGLPHSIGFSRAGATAAM